MQVDQQRTDPARNSRPRPLPGRTVVSESAVAKVVALAAHTVPGVHAFGSAAARSVAALRGAIGRSDLTAGVRVEVGTEQVAADISLIAAYGYPLQTLADSVRSAVYAAVEALVGLTVVEVNVEVADVFTGEPVPERPTTAEPGTRDRLGRRLSTALKAATPSEHPEQPKHSEQPGEPS